MAAQHFLAPVGTYRVKRQGVVRLAIRPMTEHESRLARTRFGLYKPLVHRLYHAVGGAVIHIQHIVAPCGGFPRAQVAVDVCPAKAVDGLFGVTNQQQSTAGVVVRRAVNAVKQAILQRRSVLKLINQRHGVLRQDAAAQIGTVLSTQCRIQPLQHVGKAERARLPFEPLQAQLHLRGSVQAQGNRRLLQRLQLY